MSLHRRTIAVLALAGTLLMLVSAAIPVPPCPETACEVDVDPATPAPDPVAVDD